MGAWETEAALVRDFVARVSVAGGNPWTVYAETAGWDLLLVHRDGYQVGIEAKLALNAKAIEQALSDQHSSYRLAGPDYRGILVPAGKVQKHLGAICTAIGVRVIPMRDDKWYFPDLPNEASNYGAWPNWCPGERCTLPDYVPDVEGGHAAPVALTPWKIKAIKLLVLLERRGVVCRRDMNLLQISPSRWTDAYLGFLAHDPGRKGYVACARTPDLRAQHPVNYAEIEADWEKWGQPMFGDGKPVYPETLFERSAP